ncbi:MAG: phosphomannomutase/phosphoglucomutase [Magnetococcales bacterium]|nr:phosphomannomutase/phosphoglucomutase [Magnetococcales bacterium]
MGDFNQHMFREYDIRGIAGKDLTEDLLVDFGRVFAAHLQAKTGQKNLSVAIARDGRVSSPGLAKSLASGLCQGGVEVIDIGLAPTPTLYFATHHFSTDAGIMLTGSHNPPDYNGIKMVRGNSPVYGAEIQALKDGLLKGVPPLAAKLGEVRQESIIDIYLDRLISDFNPGRPMKVIFDCGNGVTGVAAPGLSDRLANFAIDSEVLFPEVDGTFPNHHPDPTVPKNLKSLRQRMGETGAELGIAFDGDGDRIGALDEQGRVVWGDRLMILFGRQILAVNPGSMVIGDVKCSQLLFDAIAEAGGKPLMWKTGHSLVKAKMRETGAPLAGEMSGHLFFADRYYGFDDALYAAVRLIELVASQPTVLSERLFGLPTIYATPELRIDCPDDKKFQVMERVLEEQQKQGSDFSAVDGVRVKVAGGWWLLRVSNTQPALVARVEADSMEGLNKIAGDVADILGKEGIAFPDWEEA